MGVPGLGVGVGEGFVEWAEEVYEWLGMLELGGERVREGGGVDGLLCAWRVGDEVEPAGVEEVGRVRVRGVLGAEWVEEVWRVVEGVVGGWRGMVVHGFEDVPVGWGGKRRGVMGRSGDGYSVVWLPGEEGRLVFELVGGQEEYS